MIVENEETAQNLLTILVIILLEKGLITSEEINQKAKELTEGKIEKPYYFG